MHKKFDDDIFARCLVIIKNVVISFINEYRGTTLRPDWSCVLYIRIFKMAAILSSRQTFSPEVIPEVEDVRKIAISISDILSFWSTL